MVRPLLLRSVMAVLIASAGIVSAAPPCCASAGKAAPALSQGSCCGEACRRIVAPRLPELFLGNAEESGAIPAAEFNSPPAHEPRPIRRSFSAIADSRSPSAESPPLFVLHGQFLI